jgi:hypothetical protein
VCSCQRQLNESSRDLVASKARNINDLYMNLSFQIFFGTLYNSSVIAPNAESRQCQFVEPTNTMSILYINTQFLRMSYEVIVIPLHKCQTLEQNNFIVTTDPRITLNCEARRHSSQ